MGVGRHKAGVLSTSVSKRTAGSKLQESHRAERNGGKAQIAQCALRI